MHYVFAGLLVGVGNVLAFFLESRFSFLERQLMPALGVSLPSGVEVPLIAAAMVSLALIGVVGLLMSQRAFVVMPVILAAPLLALLAPAFGFAPQAFYGVTPIMATIALFAVIGAFVLMEQGTFLRIEDGRAVARLKVMVALAAANAGIYYYFSLYGTSPWMGFGIFAAAYIFAGLVIGLIAAAADAIEAQEAEWMELAKQVPKLERKLKQWVESSLGWENTANTRTAERDEARAERDQLKGQLVEKDERIVALEAQVAALRGGSPAAVPKAA